MAWPWLALAARSIPWTTLIRRAPEIIEASAALIATRRINRTDKTGTTAPESESDALLERLKNLEGRSREQTEIVEQIAKQAQDLTQGIEVLAARQRVLLLFVLAAVLVAFVGIVVALI